MADSFTINITITANHANPVVSNGSRIAVRVRNTDEVVNVVPTVNAAPAQDENTTSKFQTDYSAFFNVKAISDVGIIDAQGEIIYAHKIILAKNSTYFATIFKHPTLKENMDGEIDAKNFSPLVVKQMLKYLYAGQMILEDEHNNLELIQQFLEASDFYGIPSLTAYCEEQLIKKISNENLIPLLKQCEIYKLSKFQAAAAEWIQENKDLVLMSSEFQEFNKEYPSLVYEIMLKLLKVNQGSF